MFLSFSAIFVFLSSCKCSHTCIQLFLSPLQYYFVLADLTLKTKESLKLSTDGWFVLFVNVLGIKILVKATL